MKPSALFCCHCLLLGFYLLVLKAIAQVVDTKGRRLVAAGEDPYGGQWKFLTVINLGLKQDLEKMWKVKVNVIPIVIGALGAVTPKLKERLQQIPGRTSQHSIQKSALLGTAKILRSTLKLPGLWQRTRDGSLSAIFFGISSLNDAFVLMKKFRIAKFIFPIRDLLFAALIFPFALFVFTMFWMIYSYDPELIYPKSIDMIIPTWLNHAMHTTILPLTLLDLLITPRRYPSKAKGLGLLAITSVAYISWMFWYRSVTGKWIYPLFDNMNEFMRAAMFAGSAFFLLLAYNVGAFLCRMIWGDTVVIVDIYKRKSK